MPIKKNLSADWALFGLNMSPSLAFDIGLLYDAQVREKEGNVYQLRNTYEG